MSWVATAVIGGAVVGGLASKSAAKSSAAAQDRATEASLESFRFSKPYIKENYDKAKIAKNDMLQQGAYRGPTLAGANPYENVGNRMVAQYGMAMMPRNFGMASTGAQFANNYDALMGQTQQDRMGAAQQYAMDNSAPLVNAALRDDFRRLNENTLTGINMGASASGNMNSSRAGIADAIANRDYLDRRADVTAGIQDQLMQRNLAQQNAQFGQSLDVNRGLQNAYEAGMKGIGASADYMTGAGGNLRGFQQAIMDDRRRRFEDQRDFGLDTAIKYQQGILGQADYDSPQVNPNLYNSSMSSFGGAMQGVGMGLDLYKAFKED